MGKVCNVGHMANRKNMAVSCFWVSRMPATLENTLDWARWQMAQTWLIFEQQHTLWSHNHKNILKNENGTNHWHDLLNQLQDKLWSTFVNLFKMINSQVHGWCCTHTSLWSYKHVTDKFTSTVHSQPL